ncbi:MAG: histidine phosphatase family protein [Pseudomonadota bacterium]
MSTLYVVRHGQARFLTEDYDRLSETGHEQARLVGEHFVRERIQPTHVWSGTLKRQRDTASGALAVLAAAGEPQPSRATAAGLDEYPADELMSFLLPVACQGDPQVEQDAQALQQADDDRVRYRLIHRQLEAVMRLWIAGEHNVEEAGVPSWARWSGGVRDALRDAMNAPSGSTVVLFTSGGPIGVVVQTILAAPDLKAAELNWRVFNASITQVTFSNRRASLDSFNEIGHLPKTLRTHR